MADDDDYDPPHDFSLQTYVNMPHRVEQSGAHLSVLNL